MPTDTVTPFRNLGTVTHTPLIAKLKVEVPAANSKPVDILGSGENTPRTFGTAAEGMQNQHAEDASQLRHENFLRTADSTIETPLNVVHETQQSLRNPIHFDSALASAQHLTGVVKDKALLRLMVALQNLPKESRAVASENLEKAFDQTAHKETFQAYKSALAELDARGRTPEEYVKILMSKNITPAQRQIMTNDLDVNEDFLSLYADHMLSKSIDTEEVLALWQHPNTDVEVLRSIAANTRMAAILKHPESDARVEYVLGDKLRIFQSKPFPDFFPGERKKLADHTKDSFTVGLLADNPLDEKEFKELQGHPYAEGSLKETDFDPNNKGGVLTRQNSDHANLIL